MPRAKNKKPAVGPGQIRTVGSLARDIGTKRSDRLLIVCEGEKTEKIYFEAIRVAHKFRTVDVCVVGTGGAPITVVDTALDLREAQIRKSRGYDAPFDEVWCVFDTEIPHENTSLWPAINKAKENDLRLAVSNPCFEF